MSFLDTMTEKAKSSPQRIVLPESFDPRTIEATAKICELGIAVPILLGNREELLAAAKDFDISGATIIDHLVAPEFSEYVNKFYELRKAKGVTPEQAEEFMRDPVYFACMMVKEGAADGMVSGAVHSTADTLRPALQIVRTAPDTKVVSTFFVMDVPNCDYGENGVFVFSDCGLMEDPTAEQLSEIATASAKSFEAMVGREPVVAMLSYSTYGSAKSPLVEKVQTATALAKERYPNLKLDGELQLDAAIVPSVGKQKAPTSPVAGKANVLIFPDLNAGNIGYKLVQRLAKAEAYGPITQGMAKPINDLSRGASADDIVGVVAITCVQAQTK